MKNQLPLQSLLRFIPFFLICIFCVQQLSAQLSWQRMPGPPGGFSFGSFAVGTGGKWLQRGSIIGVHESADGGQNWRWNALPTSIHTEAALHIAVDGHLWFFDRDEVLHSADNGRNWVEVEGDSSLWIENDFLATLVLDSANMLGAKGSGIVRSTNLGKTLTTVFPVVGGLDALAYNPANGHVFSWKTAPVAGQINKIYRSTDGGLNWSIWENDPLMTGRTINRMVFAPNGSVLVTTDQWMLRSTDDGATWTQTTVRAGDVAVASTGRILIENLDGTFTERTFYSDDNGESWQLAPVGLMRKFAVMPDGTIFAEYNYTGLYRSNDNGDSWQFSAFGINHHTSPVTLHFYPDNGLVAITQTGVFYSPNAATNWEIRYNTLDQMETSVQGTVLPSGTICCVFDNKIMLSTDRGVTWTEITPAGIQAGSAYITIRQVDGVLFATGDDVIFRSEDEGNTWQNLGDIQLNPPAMSADGTFWAYNYGSTLQKSTDRGLTWTPVSTPVSNQHKIFPLPNGALLLLGGGKIHRSVNNGASWTTTNQTYMNGVGATLVNAAGHLFVVGNQIADVLLMSADDGQTWQFVTQPQSYWADYYLYMAPDERLWFASGDGVWRTGEPSSQLLTIGGSVGTDLIDDCTLAFSEPRLSRFMVKSVGANGQTKYGMSDETGYYRLLSKAGEYQVSAIAPNELWEPCTLPVTVPAMPSSGNIGGKNVAIKPAALCPRLEVDVAVPLLRRCFQTKMAVSYRNTGTQTATNARIELALDPYLEVLGTSMPIAAQSGDTLVFELGAVQANAKSTIYIDILVSCDAALSQMHCTEAKIFPDVICSGWQGSVISTRMECLGDSILLEIKNTGAGDMPLPRKWQVWRGIWTNFDSLLVSEGNFQLPAGGIFTKKIATPGDATLLLRVPQETGYPFGSGYAQSVLLHCDDSGYLPYTYEYQVYEPSRDLLCLRNIGSFDPNDKTGFPEGIGAGHHIEKTEPLEYLIRFQNTGTDTAFTVVIRDTISPLLNMETLLLGAASHAVLMNVRDSNELVFAFNNIMLPDSNINEVNSHGFVKYSIRQKADNLDGEVIRNRAGIYFDFNLPVITNETWHTVGLPQVSGLSDIANKKIPVLLCSPNPFSERFWVTLSEEVASSHLLTTQGLSLEITDASGRVLRQQAFSGDKMLVERGDLPSGMLFIYLKTASGAIVASGKVVAGNLRK